VQYAYDDRSVVVVNGTLKEHKGLKATARVLDLASKELLARTAPWTWARREREGPEGAGAGRRHPTTSSSSARRRVRPHVSRNVYWLSTKPDVLAWTSPSGTTRR